MEYKYQSYNYQSWSIYETLRQKINDIRNNDKASRFISAYNKYFTKSDLKGLKSTVVANIIHSAITLQNPKNRHIIGSRKEKFAVKLRPFIHDFSGKKTTF